MTEGTTSENYDVLFLDDNIEWLQLAEARNTREGNYSLETFSDPEKAAEAVRDLEYDLIVTDWFLKDNKIRTGGEFIEKLLEEGALDANFAIVSSKDVKVNGLKEYDRFEEFYSKDGLSPVQDAVEGHRDLYQDT